jgi:two-component system chemotaxis response regulator CheY
METKNTKILIVDDSVFMRTVLKNILENDGYKDFFEAGNGNEALEKIKAENPDLVLLDVIMPEKGGIDVLKEVGITSKIIMISAVGQDKIMEEARSLGAKGYIIKPFDNKLVSEEVKKVLG